MQRDDVHLACDEVSFAFSDVGVGSYRCSICMARVGEIGCGWVGMDQMDTLVFGSVMMHMIT